MLAFGLLAVILSAVIACVDDDWWDSHTEDSIPRANGRMRYSPYAWREELLRANCDMQAWRAYRSLRVASETARYHAGNTIPSTAHDYFADLDVDRYVATHLGQVKLGLGVN